jgi:hypothetical protein
VAAGIQHPGKVHPAACGTVVDFPGVLRLLVAGGRNRSALIWKRL